jgi:hypothetical protein
MDQAVMVFANASARSAAIVTPSAGMTTFRQDGTVAEVYNGTAWVSANSVGGTLAGSQISGAITSASINAANVSNTLTASTATTYTFASGDQSSVFQFSNAGTVTATVGTSTALTAGQRIDVLADGAAGVRIAAGSGVSFAGGGTAGTVYFISQYNAATILCVGSNAYRIIGNITAV